MQINKQRLQLWLNEKVAAYNNGSSQDIEMIKELCKRSNPKSIPSGSAKFYTNDEIGWYPLDTIDGMPHKPVSWFFEADGPRYEVQSWVSDYGIWDNWNKEFVGRPIESRALAEKILKWYLSIEEK